MDVQVHLNRPQTRAYRAFRDGQTVTLSWGRGVGKSEFILLCMFLLVAAWDGIRRLADLQGVRVVYLLPAATQARKTVLARFQAKLYGQFAFLRGSLNLTSLRADFPGGSWIQFVSAEQGQLNRGIRCDAIFTDEADDVERELYAAVAAPWLSEPWSLKRCMLGGTPTRGRHGLLYQHHALGMAREPGFTTVHATWRDAPEHVDADYVRRQRRVLELGGQLATFEREWECNFDAGEGLVYPMFAPDLHVREPHAGTVWTEYLIGCDHGYEDPAVRLVIGVAGSGQDAIAWVLEETYQNHQVPLWWQSVDRSLCERFPRERTRWYADPSRPDLIAQMRQVGARCVDTDNAIEPGVACVANFMAPRMTEDGRRFARLYIHPQCKNLIRELGLYRRKRDTKNADLFTDDIEDRNNHACDSLRYALVSRFGRPQSLRHETA